MAKNEKENTNRGEKIVKQTYNNSLVEIPLIEYSKRRLLCESEVESIHLVVRGYDLNECLKALTKAKQMFNVK